METNNNNNDHGDSNPSSRGITPCEGETILLLLFDFVWDKKQELGTMSIVNRRLHVASQEYFYYHMDHKYPQVSLNGYPTSIPRMVEMYVPPKIVPGAPAIDSMLSYEDGQFRYKMSMPASQIIRDPRITDSFGLMSWSEKAKAIVEYATKVEFWYSSNTTRNPLHGFIKDYFSEHPRHEMLSLSEEELSKIKVCFYERVFKETVHRSAAADWSIWYSQHLLEYIPTDSGSLLAIVSDLATTMRNGRMRIH